MPDRVVGWLVKEDYHLSEESNEQKDDIQEFLKILGERRKITEEEVIFYREKKICLVCKGKVGGVMYMCTKCDALYCIKCAEAISNLENACWACNEPIDKSRPSTPFKSEGEVIKSEISEKLEKKPKTDKNS
ncbi:MAG: hypothetical protein ACFFHV_18690 [Promethearchaeota archaeon]